MSPDLELMLSSSPYYMFLKFSSCEGKIKLGRGTGENIKTDRNVNFI
jgi:hypothetical protein